MGFGNNLGFLNRVLSMTVMNNPHRALDLRNVALFAQVSPEALRAVTQDMVKHFRNGEFIFRHGDDENHLVVLLDGQACVYRGEIFITCRSAPAVIGEQAFIDETTRSATLIAQGFVKALILPEGTVQELMRDNIFVRNLLRIVSCKLREATEERERHYRREELLFSEFKAHASDAMVDSLLATGVDYGSPRFIKDAVILISDIRDFTTRSASMSPDEIAEQLSSYLSEIVDTIHRHGGLVDKFVGDAVMAVWGYTASDRKAEDAFECAKEMVSVAARMQFGGQPILIGVGLNTGEVFSGNVGNESKKQFTVLGMPVNLAARFESKAKDLKSPIVMGGAFYNDLPTETQGRFTAHHEQDIKGDCPQTLYTFDPVRDEEGTK
jgi:class 3 adenylate cyclase